MKTERTPEEVQAEIEALEECKKYAPHYTAFGDDNHRGIDRQIEFLKGDIDTTAAEFDEDLSFDEQSQVFEAERWLEGEEDEAPSSGWDTWKPKS